MISKSEFIRLMYALQACVEKDDKACDTLACIYNSHFEFIVELTDPYVALVADTLAAAMGGDRDRWIHWFVFDNDFGHAGREVKVDGTLMQVKSPDMLYDIISESGAPF